MLDGNYGSHPVTDIRTCKVGIFFLQDADLTGVAVHNGGKGCLKSSKMGAALCIVNIVAKAQYILTEFIGVLKCSFRLDSARFPFQVHWIVKSF